MDLALNRDGVLPMSSDTIRVGFLLAILDPPKIVVV
jgi:hypothetical protein